MPQAPQYRRGTGPDQMPFGAAAQANQALANAPEAPAPPALVPSGNETPQAPPVRGNLTGHDDIVFGPTDRPDEPLTAGASFGAGPGLLPHRGAESDQEFMVRVTGEMANSPTANWLVKNLAVRAQRGE